MIIRSHFGPRRPRGALEPKYSVAILVQISAVSLPPLATPRATPRHVSDAVLDLTKELYSELHARS